jgi:O-antigen ligase
LKYAFLTVALLAVLPLAGWLRNNKRHVPKFWVFVGFFPFGITIFHGYFAVISWPYWPGYVKGLEISLLDLLLIALYLTLPSARTVLPFRASMLFYLIAVLFAVLQASVPMAAIFYVWQIARMFFVYMVIARASQDLRVTKCILTGLLFGLCYEACFVIWQRFILGELQAEGSFGHQNTLGMMSHFVVFPFFALLLAGKKGWEPIVATFAGIVIALLTVSRATIGLAAIGYFALFALAALRKWTRRLTLISLVALALVAAITPVVIASFNQRFGTGPLDHIDDERAAFEKAARMMLSDHPLGVGPNHFVVVANTSGYYTRVGIAPLPDNRGATVHNSYLLAAGETGYIGLTAFIILILHPLVVACRVGWLNRKDERGNLLLGFAVALSLIYLQSLYEWLLLTFDLQYMFVLTIGMVAGLVQQLRHSRRSIVPIGKTESVLLKVPDQVSR